MRRVREEVARRRGRVRAARPAKGYDGSAGKGPGGSGADSTLGRNMRWVLRFKVTSGRDYLDQLEGDGRGRSSSRGRKTRSKCVFYSLGNDMAGNQPMAASPRPTLRRAGRTRFKFSDARRDAGQRRGRRAAGWTSRRRRSGRSSRRSLEDELARKETGYRNKPGRGHRGDDLPCHRPRRPSYELVVDEQKMKR